MIIVKPTDKTGGLAILPFEGYDLEVQETLAEKYVEEGEEKQKYPKSSEN